MWETRRVFQAVVGKPWRLFRSRVTVHSLGIAARRWRGRVGVIVASPTRSLRVSARFSGHAERGSRTAAATGCSTLYMDGASLTITYSTVSGNTNNGASNIVCVNNVASLTAQNSTFSGNSSSVGGGGIFVSGPATFTNCTIANNTSNAGNAAVTAFSANVTLIDTIVANNPGGNCAAVSPGTIVDGGNNLQFPSYGCGATIATADPLLGPLASNGGPTQTMALQFGSPAINAGNAATCLATDQRGQARVGTCDIGAFEFNPAAPGATPVPMLDGRGLALLAVVLAVLGALLLRR